MHLKSLFLLAAIAKALAITPATATATATAEPSTKPALVWEQRAIDFGRLEQNSEIHAAFKFANQGKSVASITSAASSCGCTTATLKKITYSPGEAGEIKVVFKPGQRVGPQVKRVVVRTDDPRAPVTTLTLRANILDVVDVTPRLLVWAADEPREPKVVTVTVAEGDAVTLTELVVDPKAGVKVEVDEVKTAAVVEGAEPAAATNPANPANTGDGASAEAKPLRLQAEPAEAALPPGARVYQVTVHPPADGQDCRAPVRVVTHDAEGKPLPERAFLVRAIAAAPAKAEAGTTGKKAQP